MFHQYFISGALQWGGSACKQTIPDNTRFLEFFLWNGLIIALFFFLGIQKWISNDILMIKKHLLINQPSVFGSLESYLSRFLSILHFGMYFHLIYFKFNSKGMICLTQPCHVILLLQGIALFNHRTPIGTLLTLYLLPSLIGTILAMVCPDTSGLDQFLETESYWIQHYLICAPVPLFLLIRNNFLATKMVTLKTIIVGAWFLAVAHWSFFDPLDYIFEVNVEFMLCPSAGMKSIFDSLPIWLVVPSYRSTMTIIVLLIAAPLSYSFSMTAKLFEIILSPLTTQRPKKH